LIGKSSKNGGLKQNYLRQLPVSHQEKKEDGIINTSFGFLNSGFLQLRSSDVDR